MKAKITIEYINMTKKGKWHVGYTVQVLPGKLKPANWWRGYLYLTYEDARNAIDDNFKITKINDCFNLEGVKL